MESDFTLEARSHVMIDLETLDTSPTAKILSIGAYIFRGTNRGATFYRVVDQDSYKYGNFTEDVDTRTWWSVQGAAWEEIENYPCKKSAFSVLADFKRWLDAEAKEPFIWSNGASFDIPILINHYSELGVTHRSERPWNFWDECCMRTAISQTEEKIDKSEGVLHNALDDAIRQGRFLQRKLGSTFLLNMERKAWLKKKEEDSEGII